MRKTSKARTILTGLGLGFALMATTACGSASTGWTSKTGGAMVVLHKESGNATSHSDASKQGSACSMNILGLISMGDSSVKAAKAAGGITKVSTVDFKYMNILALFGQVCTEVKGS
jgi:hypothetical protein